MGCFSWFGLGPLVPVIGNMNSEMYMDFLDNAALPTLRQYFVEGPFLFQQDNCSIHTSRLSQTWFDEMDVQKLDWLFQSTDLNPIEHFWDELASAVMDTWKSISMATYQNWWKVFPDVCRLSSMKKKDKHHINMCLRTV